MTGKAAADRVKPAPVGVAESIVTETVPVEVKVTQLRSGSFQVQGRLKEPVTTGKVWFRVNAESNDGCDDNSTWNVFADK